MSLTNYLEGALLDLIFFGTPIPNIADNAAVSPLTSLYISLHTGDPGEAGNQASSECAYGTYARIALVRTTSGWVRAGNVVNPAADIVFAQPSSGIETATHIGIGTASSGAGNLLLKGALSPTIAISVGMTQPPTISSASTITLE